MDRRFFKEGIQIVQAIRKDIRDPQTANRKEKYFWTEKHTDNSVEQFNSELYSKTKANGPNSNLPNVLNQGSEDLPYVSVKYIKKALAAGNC